MVKKLTYEQLAKKNTELEEELNASLEELEAIKRTLLPNSAYCKQNFSRLNENVNDVVYRFDLKNRCYEYVSPQVLQVFGYSEQEFYLNPSLIKNLIHPDSTQEYQRQWKNLLSGKVPEYCEVKIQRKDGQTRWILQKYLVVKDNDKNVACIEGIITDITDRKEAEEALIESEAQKEAILNNLPHLAWLKDCNGVYLSVNESFASYIKRPVNEIIGKTDFDFYEPEDARRYRDDDLHVILNRKQIYIEEKSRGLYWETFKAPIFNNNNEIIGVTGIALEITTRKKSEEEVKKYSEKLSLQNLELKQVNDELKRAKEKAEEADRLKSAFLANMSHEIRTPMNAIQGFATLLRDRKLPEKKQVDFINLINSNCRQLLSIISDIIDISKIEANQITVFNKSFDINKTIKLLDQNFKNQIKTLNKPITLKLNSQLEAEKAFIYTDKVRLEQILSNLLSNAVKFTDGGEVELGYYLSDDLRKIIFYVCDTGIGMSVEEQEIIFERFRQVSCAYNKQYGGTGIGLSISKGLVQKLGGEIWVKSKIGKGSTFYFSIPYKHEDTGKPERIPYETNFNWVGKTILIVEDEQANYSLLENIIQPSNAHIIWAKDGLEAITACKKHKEIDLVLMDIKMPIMNGIEATKHIKKQRQSLPVIAQTAFATPKDKENCMNAGCDDYLAKPLSVEDILGKIDKHLRTSDSDNEHKNTSVTTDNSI